MTSQKALKLILLSVICLLTVTDVRADALRGAGEGLFAILVFIFLFLIPIVLAFIFIIVRFVTNKPAFSIGVYLGLTLSIASSGLGYSRGVDALAPFLFTLFLILAYGTIDIIVIRRSNRA